MNILHVNLAMRVMAVILLCSTLAITQLSPSTQKAASVRITEGPAIERADANSAIITWRSNNPGGAPEHYGVVYYGKNPGELSQTAKSKIRLNPSHSYTVFRVWMPDLQPQTTYYYKVDSMEANGNSDGVQSPLKQFTTRERGN